MISHEVIQFRLVWRNSNWAGKSKIDSSHSKCIYNADYETRRDFKQALLRACNKYDHIFVSSIGSLVSNIHQPCKILFADEIDDRIRAFVLN